MKERTLRVAGLESPTVSWRAEGRMLGRSFVLRGLFSAVGDVCGWLPDFGGARGSGWCPASWASREKRGTDFKSMHALRSRGN